MAPGHPRVGEHDAVVRGAAELALRADGDLPPILVDQGRGGMLPCMA